MLSYARIYRELQCTCLSRWYALCRAHVAGIKRRPSRAYKSIILMSRNNTEDADVIHRRNKSSGLKLEYSLCSRVKIPARIPVNLPAVVSWRAMQTIECCIGGHACIFMPLTVMQAYHLSRVVREHRCSRPFAYVDVPTRAGTYGQPVAAQFLRKFLPRLPKLTPTVNHSLRKVHASPNRSPIYDAKRTVISILTVFLKYSPADHNFNRQKSFHS